MIPVANVIKLFST